MTWLTEQLRNFKKISETKTEIKSNFKDKKSEKRTGNEEQRSELQQEGLHGVHGPHLIQQEHLKDDIIWANILGLLA